jgi:hypothetical protein
MPIQPRRQMADTGWLITKIVIKEELEEILLYAATA